MKKYYPANSQAQTREGRFNGRLTLPVKAAFVSLGFLFGAQFSTAQIVDQIQANVSHSFIIGNTTFPPGKYDFRVQPDSDLGVMTITSEDGKMTSEFLIRDAHMDHMPQHSELIFKRYGQKEFLSKVFEQGSRTGSAVTEVSRQEQRLQKQGQQSMEHSETPAGME